MDTVKKLKEANKIKILFAKRTRVRSSVSSRLAFIGCGSYWAAARPHFGPHGPLPSLVRPLLSPLNTLYILHYCSLIQTSTSTGMRRKWQSALWFGSLQLHPCRPVINRGLGPTFCRSLQSRTSILRLQNPTIGP